jgi:site-specific recombinase XerD
MVLWESKDSGETWQKTKSPTANSQFNHSYARRPLNAHKDFYAFWADGHADTLSPSRLYFVNKKGAVRQLPYQMASEKVKPQKLIAR